MCLLPSLLFLPPVSASDAHPTGETVANSDGGSPTFPPSLNGLETHSPNPGNPWDDLRRLTEEGLTGLLESNEALSTLETQLGTLKAETQEQRRLLSESLSLLESLRRSLAEAENGVEIALDRMRDAEDYARWVDSRNAALELEARRAGRSALAAFAFGGASFGLGVPLVAGGIAGDNRAMLVSGAGTVAVGSAIWALGRYVFKWW